MWWLGDVGLVIKGSLAPLDSVIAEGDSRAEEQEEDHLMTRGTPDVMKTNDDKKKIIIPCRLRPV